MLVVPTVSQSTAGIASATNSGYSRGRSMVASGSAFSIGIEQQPMSVTGVDPLSDLLRPMRRTVVVDVGANPIDGDPPYKRMLAKGICEVIGFEPQSSAMARLELIKGPNERYLPFALGDGSCQTLRICRASGLASLKVPNPAHMELFNLFSGWSEVIAEVPLSTHRLDDVAEITAMDFLKMDIQGSELDVLSHAGARLAEAVCVQTEVSFVPLYEGQPSFGEIDVFLRQAGFIPHCFAELKIWPLAPTVIDNEPRKGLRQLLEADLVYVRDFSDRDNLAVEQWKHLALIAHHVYGSVDLAARAIAMVSELGAAPPHAVRFYLDSLKIKNTQTRAFV